MNIFTNTIFFAGTLATLLGLFPCSVRAEEPGTEALREALTSYVWTWNSPPRKVRVRFLPDGTAKFSDGTSAPWKITGPRNVHFGENCPLVFDETLTKYTGFNHTRHWKLYGERKERSGETASAQPSPTAAPPPAPSPAVPVPTELATTSMLDGITENGPQITDQILGPLDVPTIPEATASLWKEDLLDEAGRDPAANQEVYQQAALLLDAWKAALRERNLIAEKSKYSGAVMDKTDMAASRKTTLHMWDWLQYQRERDDAAKHEKTLERTADFFAAGPPKRWADRSAVLRVNIEKLYKAYRKSLRDSLNPSPTPARP